MVVFSLQGVAATMLFAASMRHLCLVAVLVLLATQTTARQPDADDFIQETGYSHCSRQRFHYGESSLSVAKHAANSCLVSDQRYPRCRCQAGGTQGTGLSCT
eukprot:GHRR01031742.1.p1 GENE.GHRR01031742.1~~GHRR01031742.1.p1  ORF type:complete len:102 (-),score=27.67 GHRR01031742.1:346-651(-)